MKFHARVVAGRGRGKRIGFPTVNLEPPVNFQLKQGIWACWVSLDEQRCAGAMHWGPIPVFGEKNPSLEVHILEEVYKVPQEVEVEAISWIRPIRNFKDVENLKKQIEKDIAEVRKILLN